MIPPNQNDIPAFDPVPMTTTGFVIPVADTIGKIPQDPKGIIFPDHFVDVTNKGIVHQLYGLFSNPPIRRA
jgi:hypothetical protein